MKFSSFLAVALIGLLGLSAGCKDAVQPEPSLVQPLAPPPAFPAFSLPGEIYEGADTIYRQLEKLSSDKREGVA
ncbi:hypothetical protein BH20GEM3_BH20GEM3_05650 [soil metagenome]